MPYGPRCARLTESTHLPSRRWGKYRQGQSRAVSQGKYLPIFTSGRWILYQEYISNITKSRSVYVYTWGICHCEISSSLMMPSHSLFRLLGKLRWTLACSCSPKFQQQFCNVSQNTNLAQKLVSLRAYRDTGLSHDFLHRALIVTIMIYKRRYGWQRWLNNSFQRSERIHQWEFTEQ